MKHLLSFLIVTLEFVQLTFCSICFGEFYTVQLSVVHGSGNPVSIGIIEHCHASGLLGTWHALPYRGFKPAVHWLCCMNQLQVGRGFEHLVTGSVNHDSYFRNRHNSNNLKRFSLNVSDPDATKWGTPRWSTPSSLSRKKAMSPSLAALG